MVPVRVGKEGLGTLDPGSLVRRGTWHGERQNSVPTSILSFSALFQYEEKQQQAEVCFPSFQRRAELAGRNHGKTRKETGDSSFLVCPDPGNDKQFDPGLASSLNLRDITFPIHGILRDQDQLPLLSSG